MKQLSLLEPLQSTRPLTPAKETPFRDATRQATAVFLAGSLATADGLATMFARLFPSETDAVADYLTAVERLRRIFDEASA